MTMSRIHPTQTMWVPRESDKDDGPCVLTVWKKSSMAFQGTDGFSVFDKEGRLVFRVDNYSRRSRYFTRRLVLMDGVGRPLLSLRPQILSACYQWNGFEGDGDTKSKSPIPVFSLKRRSLFQKNDEAEVFMGGLRRRVTPDFRIEGSFRRRNCKILTSSGELVAEISRKRVKSTILLSEDVFNLIIRPGFSPELIMAFIIVIDRICRKPLAPILCS